MLIGRPGGLLHHAPGPARGCDWQGAKRPVPSVLTGRDLCVMLILSLCFFGPYRIGGDGTPPAGLVSSTQRSPQPAWQPCLPGARGGPENERQGAWNAATALCSKNAAVATGASTGLRLSPNVAVHHVPSGIWWCRCGKPAEAVREAQRRRATSWNIAVIPTEPPRSPFSPTHLCQCLRLSRRLIPIVCPDQAARCRVSKALSPSGLVLSPSRTERAQYARTPPRGFLSWSCRVRDDCDMV